MFKRSLIALSGAVMAAACVSAAREPAPASATPAVSAQTAPAAAPADGNPRVGSVAMLATRPIAASLATVPDLSTLATALKTAGLIDRLSGPDALTVFAPTNDAFARLAPGTVERLLRPENTASLSQVLRYHVVPGAISAARLRAMIASGGGAVSLPTLAGSTLTARMEGDAIALTDTNGTKSYVETPDVRQSNGVIHVINGVAVPKLD